jgi:hypothetical protein
MNWLLGLGFLFVFQVVGMLLWFNAFPKSKEFMIFPFILFGLATGDFDPYFSTFFFSLEPILISLGEYLAIRHVYPNKA